MILRGTSFCETFCWVPSVKKEGSRVTLFWSCLMLPVPQEHGPGIARAHFEELGATCSLAGGKLGKQLYPPETRRFSKY